MNLNEALTLNIAKLFDHGSEKLRSKNEVPRNYLGASVLGEECDRHLWYEFKYPEIDDFSPRTKRIFSLGHAIENLVIDTLEISGLIIKDKQAEFICGNIAGHADGVISGLLCSSEDHLLEVKGLKDSSFVSLKKTGLCQYSKRYWVQCNVYMNRLGLKKCLFVAMNKDNCEMYFERFDVDDKLAWSMIQRGQSICVMNEPPSRPYKYKNFYKCKMCNYNEKCWG